MAKSLTRERGVVLDRGYLFIRFWPWGRKNKPYIEHFGPSSDNNITIANYKMREYRNKVALGNFDIARPAIPMLFKDAWPIFVKNHKASLASYGPVLIAYFGSYFLHDITPQHVKDFRKVRETRDGVSFATTNKNQAILASLFERFKEWNAVGGVFVDKVKLPTENPCAYVTKPTERHRARKRALSPEEWERLSPHLAKVEVFSKNASTPVYTAGWLLDHCKMALYSSLSLRDISNLSGKQITGDVLEGVRSKTGMTADLPLTESIRAIALRISARPYVTAAVVQKYFRECCAAANILNCTFRDLRRTSLRRMDKMGVSRTVVRDRAAHGDLKTTEGYLGSDFTEQREAIHTIEKSYK